MHFRTGNGMDSCPIGQNSAIFLKKNAKRLAYFKKKVYFCTLIWNYYVLDFGIGFKN